MRATISFEVDVERVQETMAALVLQEAVPLHQATDLVENTEPQDLYDGITQALEILGSVSAQLQQYRDMLVNFEQAKFQTILPQPAGQTVSNLGELKDTVEKMKMFDGFVQKMAAQGEEPEDESQEG